MTSTAFLLALFATLVPGFTVQKTLGGAEEHVYEVRLAAGEALIANVDQQGVDVVIEIDGPRGAAARFDSPNGDHGPEPIDFTALADGVYRLVLRAGNMSAPPGTYVLRVDRVIGAIENAKRLMKASCPSATLYDVWLSSLSDPAAVDRFLASRSGRPAAFEIVPLNAAESRVVYVVGGDSDTERVIISGGPEFGVVMRRLGRTNLFFGTQVIPNDARFEYSFALREVHHAGRGGEVEVAEIVSKGPWLLEMPNAPPQPDTVADAKTPAGAVERATIQSEKLAENRDLVVYTPPNYDRKHDCNLLIVFDGGVYGGVEHAPIPTPTILDHLIASQRIAPTVAILVMSMGKRNRDLTGNPAFAAFVAGELVPWARAHYAIADGADRVAVAGSSFGGFAAAYCALHHPSVIGNVISQSGAYWVTTDWQSIRPPYPHDTGMLIDAFKQSERLPIRFYLDVGRFDLGAALLGSNRELRDVLQTKGYEVDYHEFDGGHDESQWRGSLSDALLFVFGAARS